MKINYVISLLIICSITFSCELNNYVAYKPHYLSSNNEHKYYGEASLDSTTLKNTIQVLTFYKEDYKIVKDTIMI